jgi:type II secretory pathway pseudopilin PulG
MKRHSAPIRRGFTLMSLMLPAVQKIRDAANQNTSRNNLRNITLAAINAATQMKKLPSVGAGNPYPTVAPNNPNGFHCAKYGSNWGSPLFHLLPFLEEVSYYTNAVASMQPGAANYGTYGVSTSPGIKILTTPIDSTSQSGQYGLVTGGSTNPLSAASYGYNYYVQNMMYPDDITDGTSKTILFAEKMAVCTSSAGTSSGGTAWAVGYGSATGDATSTPPDYYAYAAVILSPAAAGVAVVDPSFGFKNCSAYYAPSTVSRYAINSGFADGSVRSISSGIVGTGNWNRLMTPNLLDNTGEEMLY